MKTPRPLIVCRDSAASLAAAISKHYGKRFQTDTWYAVKILNEKLAVAQFNSDGRSEFHIVRRFDLKPTAESLMGPVPPPPAQVFIVNLQTGVTREESDHGRLQLAARLYDRAQTIQAEAA